MKDNTYIIPAIDFYIVKPKWQFQSLRECENEIRCSNVIFIPFEQVEGLTVDEMVTTLDLRENFACCAMNRIEPIGGSEYINILDICLFLSDTLQNKKEMTIDQLVEKYYEVKYHSVDKKTQRIYNSFFERYRDESYEKTKNRIDRLSSKNKD